MSTTKTLKVNQNFDRLLKCRANGYYDYIDVVIPTNDNKDINVEMQDYDGLKFTWDGNGDGIDIVDFSETVLPWKFEMNNYLARKRYCARPYREEPYQVEIFKKEFSNFDIVGTPTITGDVVSGFSAGNYLQLKQAFNPSGTWEIVLKVRTAPIVSEQGLMGYKGSGLFRFMINSDNQLNLSLSTVTSAWDIGEIIGTTTLATDTDYWLKAEFTGTAYNIYVSTDGLEYNLDGSLETTSIPVFPDTTLIGLVLQDTWYFRGSIDLSESYVKLDEVVADSTDENAEIVEYAFTQPTLSENGVMGGSSFAVTADNETNGNNPAYYAFDNSTSSYWRGGNVPGYIDFYNPVPLKVTSITWGYYYSYPTSGNVQGSNDYSDWTTITEFTNDSSSDFTIDMSGNTNSYKYYRINVSAVNQGVIHCTNLSIVGTAKGYAVKNTYNLSNGSYVPKYIENYTINGTPTINEGIASGFSSSNYLTLDEPFKPEGAWEIVLKIISPSSFSLQRMLGSVGSFYKTIGGELNGNGTLGFGITSNGYSWDIGWILGQTALEPNTPYWIKLSYDGTQYKFELSSDGVDYNLENSITSSTPIYQADNSIINLGYHGTDSSTYFRGSFDLNECSIKCNGKTTYLLGAVKEELYGVFDENATITQSLYCYANKDQSVILRNTNNITMDTTDWYLGEFKLFDLDVDIDFQPSIDV